MLITIVAHVSEAQSSFSGSFESFRYQPARPPIPNCNLCPAHSTGNARATALIMVLSMVAIGAGFPYVPSGRTITLRPPRFLKVMGISTETTSAEVTSALVAITLPSCFHAYPVATGLR